MGIETCGSGQPERGVSGGDLYFKDVTSDLPSDDGLTA